MINLTVEQSADGTIFIDVRGDGELVSEFTCSSSNRMSAQAFLRGFAAMSKASGQAIDEIEIDEGFGYPLRRYFELALMQAHPVETIPAVS